jgi:hypothetical protein
LEGELEHGGEEARRDEGGGYCDGEGEQEAGQPRAGVGSDQTAGDGGDDRRVGEVKAVGERAEGARGTCVEEADRGRSAAATA